jgi:hypothetical protein
MLQAPDTTTHTMRSSGHCYAHSSRCWVDSGQLSLILLHMATPVQRGAFEGAVVDCVLVRWRSFVLSCFRCCQDVETARQGGYG